MRSKFKPWVAAAVLAAISPLAIAQGSAGNSALGKENARLKKEVASLRQQVQQGANCRPPQASAKAKTIKQWHELLVGKKDRSQVIAMLGSPGKTVSGMLWYENLVLDPDTGESHTLQIVLSPTISGGGKVTHVMFI